MDSAWAPSPFNTPPPSSRSPHQRIVFLWDAGRQPESLPAYTAKRVPLFCTIINPTSESSGNTMHLFLQLVSP